MVFSRASCPAFSITTNGETGIRQIVQKNFSSYVRVAVLHSSPACSRCRRFDPPATFGLCLASMRSTGGRGTIHPAFEVVRRGFLGPFARALRGVFGVSGGTCTKRPNRGGTAAALTIGPAATSLFRRESTCRFRPSSARGPSSWRSPLSAKTTSSTVSPYRP